MIWSPSSTLKGKATVWGYSRGGWLAFSLAATHPDRIDRIVVGG
jgi:pimeloyl-ACP methyl ester carboxylesterase